MAETGLSHPMRADRLWQILLLQATDAKPFAELFVADIICKDSMPESVRFIGKLVASSIVRPHPLDLPTPAPASPTSDGS